VNHWDCSFYLIATLSTLWTLAVVITCFGRHVPSAHTQEFATEVAQPESVAAANTIAMVIIKFLMAVLLSLPLDLYVA